MKIRTDRWHYQLYVYYFELFAGKDTSVPAVVDFCTYMRRVTVGFLKLIGAYVFVGALSLLAALVTLLANVFTVPLGIGVAVLWPDQKLLKIPFMVGRKGNKFSLAFILIPLYILALIGMGLWPGLGDSPNAIVATLHEIGVVVAGIVAVILTILLLVLIIERTLSWSSKRKARKEMKKEPEGPVADALRLAKMYLKAKKERFCPAVEFIDPPRST